MPTPDLYHEPPVKALFADIPEERRRPRIDLLFVTEASGLENLEAEGIESDRIHFVGNVMIDTLDRFLPKARSLGVPARHGLEDGGYVLVTLHRPNNVDEPDRLKTWLETFAEMGRRLGLPVVFPVHPRTVKSLESFDIELQGIRTSGPLGYKEMLALQANAGAVLTDSGGMQEETTVLGVPCLTLRANTERPITMVQGTNELVHNDAEKIRELGLEALAGKWKAHTVPETWDGRAGERIAEILGDALVG